jgi:hypothetical protein
MAGCYHGIIVTAVRTAETGGVDINEHETWKRLIIHAVPIMRYIGKGTEGLQKMRREFEEANEGITIPTLVRLLVNPRTIRERRQTGLCTE